MTAPSRTGASLYDRFSGIVDQQGLCVALVTAEQTITYVALRTAIDNCAIVLAGKGIRQGQVIAAQFSRPELYLIALLAANRLGAGMMLCPLAAVGTTGVRPDWLLSDDRVPVANRAGALVMDRTWFAQKDASGLPRRRSSRDDVAYFFGTSGSTGVRKFLKVSENNILTRMPSQQYFTDGETRMLSTIGPQSAISTEVHLTTLVNGGSAVVVPPDVPNLPYYIDLFGVTTLLTTPLILADLITLDHPRHIYRTLDRVVITGATAARKTVEQSVSRICPNLILSYGSTEIGGTARFLYDPDRYVPGIVGKIVDGIEAEIVGEDGAPVVPGAEGTIRFRRDGVLAHIGYVNDPDTSAARFRDGWFYPGDRGAFSTDGHLIIAGRDDNIINAGGNKYSLELVEAEVERTVGERCTVLIGEPLPNAVQLRVFVQGNAPLDRTVLTDFIRKRFRRVDLGELYQTESLPLTETGKKDRMALIRMLEETPDAFRKIEAQSGD